MFGVQARLETTNAEPRIENLRIEGLFGEDGMYVPITQLDREYNVLIDFISDQPIERVLFQVRWEDGRTWRAEARPFESTTTNPTDGTVMIRTRIETRRMPRCVDWWVEDAQGTPGDEPVQRIVIRNGSY